MAVANLQAVASQLQIESVHLDGSRRVVLDTDDQEEMASVCPEVELIFGDSTSAGLGCLQLTTRCV